jgi:acetolactate synthase-1/3 small subunit
MNHEREEKHIISTLVENHFGVLARVSGLLSSRGFNIDSLAVAETTDPDTSRMTIVTRGDERIIEQIIKQLYRLVDVIKVVDLAECPHVERELALIKIAADQEQRTAILQIVDVFRARTVDFSPQSITVEVTGDSRKIGAMTAMLEPFGIMEVARTGVVALSRELDGTSIHNAEKAA